MFYKRYISSKHPQIANKIGSKSEKYKFTNISLNFSNVDSGQILIYLSDFHFLLFPLFYEIWKFNRFILWLIEKGETHENFSELRMLITLFALMTHPLFEWKLRTKETALRDNFALIIKVNMLDL